MEIKELDDYENYHRQGQLLQLSDHAIDRAVVFAEAIASGDLEIPISQKECENALMHGYLLPVLDLMVQHPNFVDAAVLWATQRGYVLSTDTEVSIFQVPLYKLVG